MKIFSSFIIEFLLVEFLSNGVHVIMDWQHRHTGKYLHYL